MKKVLTLCIIHQDDKILLGMKKRGFGAGRWNGFGGKVLSEESIEDAARREVVEEAGISVGELEKIGILEFEFSEDRGVFLEVHVFKATDFTGEIQETEEMRPLWFAVSEIPYDTMWPDDKYWLPLFLKGKKFTGIFFFGKGDTILEQTLKECDTLDI